MEIKDPNDRLCSLEQRFPDGAGFVAMNGLVIFDTHFVADNHSDMPDAMTMTFSTDNTNGPGSMHPGI